MTGNKSHLYSPASRGWCKPGGIKCLMPPLNCGTKGAVAPCKPCRFAAVKGSKGAVYFAGVNTGGYGQLGWYREQCLVPFQGTGLFYFSYQRGEIMDQLTGQILELLEDNARLTAREISVMLGVDEVQVQEVIKSLEDNKVIVKYLTLVNHEKLGEEKVSALIEVRTTPQREIGFDGVAERIYRFPQVRNMLLMSGTYDLAVFVEGRSMKEISHFVSTKLSTIDGVISTVTHFVLKTYKQDGVILEDGEEDRRLMISP